MSGQLGHLRLYDQLINSANLTFVVLFALCFCLLVLVFRVGLNYCYSLSLEFLDIVG